MKKLLFFLLLTLFSTPITQAGGVSNPAIESITNPTINGFTISAFSAPAYTGNREWSILFSEIGQNPARWFEMKNMSAVTGRGSTTPAPRNCTESRDWDCPIRIESYPLQATQIQCGKRYAVVFRVTSLDDNVRADSQPKEVNTANCSLQGRFALGSSGGITKITDTTARVKTEVDISGFPGPQTIEFSIAYAPEDEFDQENLEFIPLGSVQGTSKIILDKEIPDEFLCDVVYKYVLKGKLNTLEETTPIQGFRTQTTCSPSTTGGGTTPTTEGDNTYIFLTPLPLGEGLAPTDSVVIGAGEGGIFGILQRIFTIMLVAAVVLAVVFMIIGGARYATGDTLGGKMGGREVITNAVKGLLFALLAWLLLNIINPDLLRFTLSIPNIGRGLTPGTGGQNTGGGTIAGEGCGPGVSNEDCFERIAEDEPNVRERFEAAGIAVVGTQSGEVPCESYGERGCTMVGLLSNTTISSLIAIKQECRCKIQITGGTEYWNHGSGRGGNHGKFIAVDLQLQGSEYTPFNNFIKSKTSTANPFSACRETYAYRGLRFCNENGNHWHVDTVTGSGTSSSGGGGNLIKFENIGVGNNGVWGKASRQQITTSEISALVGAARSKSWYAEAQRIAGSNAKVLTAIIMVESSGDPTKDRTEPDGRKSCGLGQILTETAKDLDSTLRGKSVEEICTALKNPSYNIRLANQLYNSQSGEFKKKVAAYNGGGCSDTAGESCSRAAVAPSQNCDGLMRFECPWDSNGCYDKTKPNDRPSNTSCQVNTGYEVTRFYVDKVKKISDQL